MDQITPGRIVLYKLRVSDLARINADRPTLRPPTSRLRFHFVEKSNLEVGGRNTAGRVFLSPR